MLIGLQRFKHVDQPQVRGTRCGAAVLRDRYQFDLLYFGGLLRYWPQLSPDACSVALAEPARLAAIAPIDRNLVAGETEELYDLDSDPEELKNLAALPAHAARLRDLRAKTIAELRRTDAKFVDRMPPTKAELTSRQ